jgi:hypothetical protein
MALIGRLVGGVRGGLWFDLVPFTATYGSQMTDIPGFRLCRSLLS